MSSGSRPPSGPVSSTHGQLLEARLGQEHAQPALAELTRAGDGMAVAVGSQRGQRVVEVKRAQSLEPDHPVELGERL